VREPDDDVGAVEEVGNLHDLVAADGDLHGAVIQRAVAQLIAGKTVIIIAHRLSTITDADTIFLIADGTVAASGTHTQLLSDCTEYRSMWQAHISAKDGDAND